MNFIIDNWPLLLILIISIVFVLKFNAKKDDYEIGIKFNDLINLNNSGLVLLVDIRNNSDFNSSHIIGSVNYQNSVEEIKSVLIKNKRKTVVIVCETGKNSAALAQKLINIKNSYKIKFLIGGIANWKVEGLPVLNK